MSFDFDQVMAMPWVTPTAKVTTPVSLVKLGAPEAFVVRMATAEEMVRANDVHANLEKAKAMVLALTEMGFKQKAEALREALGIGDSLPDGYIRQIEFVIMCTVEPQLTREHVLWMARMQSFFFKSLFEKIMQLSFEGANLGEAIASTETAESE